MPVTQQDIERAIQDEENRFKSMGWVAPSWVIDAGRLAAYLHDTLIAPEQELVEALGAALRAVEWETTGRCAFCRRFKGSEGHHPDCKTANALTAMENREQVRPEIVERLQESLGTPHTELLTPEQMRAKLGQEEG